MPKHHHLKEKEIKLYASNKVLEKIYQHSLFTHCGEIFWKQKELLNQYIDTEEYALTKAKVALRVRKDGDQYIQTLKAKGHSIGGFSEREELDWYIDGPALNLHLLDTHWPIGLEKPDKSALKTIFSTDFVRKFALFTWEKNNQHAQIEVAIDSGIVKAGQKEDIISELELELREGSDDTLLDFAITLAKIFPLMPSDTSKAERGYRLIDVAFYPLLPERVFSESDIYTNVEYSLATSQRLWESYLWRPEKSKLVLWIENLHQLHGLLQKLNNNNLFILLDDLLKDWKEVTFLKEEEMLIKAKQELEKTRWGVFSLSVSHWLLNAH